MIPGVLASQGDQQHAARHTFGAFSHAFALLQQMSRGIVAMPARIGKADQIRDFIVPEEAGHIAVRNAMRLIEQALRIMAVLTQRYAAGIKCTAKHIGTGSHPFDARVFDHTQGAITDGPLGRPATARQTTEDPLEHA